MICVLHRGIWYQIQTLHCYGESDWKRIENAEYPGRRDEVIAEKLISVSVSMSIMLFIGLAYPRMHLWTRRSPNATSARDIRERSRKDRGRNVYSM